LLEVEILTALIGFGTGTIFPISTVSVQNAVDRAHLGVATGVLTFLRSLGGAIGVAALGAVALGYGLPLAGEGVHVAHGSTDASFAIIFFATAALLVAALAVLTLMPEKPLRGYDREAAPVATE
jgi:hypothetical protein